MYFNLCVKTHTINKYTQYLGLGEDLQITRGNSKATTPGQPVPIQEERRQETNISRHFNVHNSSLRIEGHRAIWK